MEVISLQVNGATHEVTLDPETPLLYVLRNDLGLKGPKFGCGLEQCHACNVLVDGTAVPSCQLPVGHVAGLAVTTVEGLGTADAMHPLQEAFVEEQAIQCGYCAAGMLVAAQGLLNRVRYPTDDDIRQALERNLCRCGVYDRVRRAIKMRVGQPIWEPIYEVREMPPLDAAAGTAVRSRSLDGAPELDAWLRLHADGTVTVYSGKAELGQGIRTAVAQIAADELDVALTRVRVVAADTAHTPDEGLTSGSMSVEMSGNAIRQAAAEARAILLGLAFEELEAQTPVDALQVDDGTITDPATGRHTTYWSLLGDRPFGRPITGRVAPKAPARRRLVGQPATRLDLVAKVTGQPIFVHDLDFPDLLHGRVLRPPNPHARLVDADLAPARALPGVVAVVRDGSFLGVVAAREEQAITALATLAAHTTWRQDATLPPHQSLYEGLRAQPAQTFLIDRTGAAVKAPAATTEPPPNAARTLRATYRRPYQMHGALAPSAAVARWADETLTVWSHTQGAFVLRGALAEVLGVPEDRLRVIHTEGSGCYGHNGADDAALDAALLARAVPGRPVALRWSREDEHGWEPYGAAMVLELGGSLDADGRVVDWQHEIWSYPHLGRPRAAGDTSGLLAAWHLDPPWPRSPQPAITRPHIDSHRNAAPLYTFPRQRIVKHFVPDSPLRTSSLRALGAYANIFAIESFIDELAHAAGADPVAFRLAHMPDERARAVIEAAAQKANWPAPPTAGDRGRGIAFAQYKNGQCYAAVVAEVRVDRADGDIRVDRLVIAADAGEVVNPDGLSNQLEGGAVQATSWTLKERVTFDAAGVTSRDWDSYPVLRFPEAPVVETVLLNRPDQPFLGAGEATQGPTGAAIANAVFNAIGVRLREIPLTPDRVRAALT